MKLPKKAIITVAGSGTRFLPATKAVPKEMLPVIDKPIAQYGVEEVVASGAEKVILVIKQGTGKVIKDHFKKNINLESQLKGSGKKDLFKSVERIAKLADFSFIEQTDRMPYGNATPLLASMKLVSDGPFFYLFGDDMTISKVPVCEQLTRVYKKNPDAVAIVAVQKIPRDQCYRYGVVKLKKGSKNIYESIVEKPKLGSEPSTLVEFGRFLFTPKIIPVIKKLKTGKDNELWLVDAINELAKTEKVLVHEIEGKWLTTGDPLNYLKATVEHLWQRDELRDEFKKYLYKKLEK